MILETERLILRPWELSDAESLYEYAKDPRVGPAAGWNVHTSVENSSEIIKAVLSAPEIYAGVPKDCGVPVGSVGLMIGDKANTVLPGNECEVGYWIGVPFWGRGYIPEAVKRLMQHGFDDLGIVKMWCGYFDGNEKSKRVSEKCGFRYHHTSHNVPCAIEGLLSTEHVTCITKDEWLKTMKGE